MMLYKHNMAAAVGQQLARRLVRGAALDSGRRVLAPGLGVGLSGVRHHSILGGRGGDGEARAGSSLHLSTAATAGMRLDDEQPQQQQGTVGSWEANLVGGNEDSSLRGPRGDWWFTGVHPRDLVQAGQAGLHSLAQPTLENVTEGDVLRYFDNTWTLTEVLFAGLQGEEAFFRPPYHHLRHPMIFYYGHTATFYTNKLRVAGLVSGGLNPYFEDIFEVGVDEMRWDDMSKNEMQWPSVLEVHEYRKQCYALVRDVIDEHVSGAGTTKVGPDHPLWALFMAFEHDRIHLETSSVLLREMPQRNVRVPEYWPALHPSAFQQPQDNQDQSQSQSQRQRQPVAGVDYPANSLIEVEGCGGVALGKDETFPTFGWDNEYGSRQQPVRAFSASQFMVSNGEFYEFVASGGYRSPEYWSEDGWGWRTFRNAKWPFFWEQDGPAGSHAYRLRSTFEVVDMPWDWPVNVNKHEASAFCAWKQQQLQSDKSEKQGQVQVRLLTEAEHMLLRDDERRHPIQEPRHDPALVHGGATMSSEGGCNLNLAYGSESPVNFHEPNARGFHDVTGNAWEWTEDVFNPLEGFKVHSYYDDFSTPCFDGEHNMIMGGSFMSSGDAGANLHCRYHFRPHFLQHSGFRYVVAGPSAPSAPSGPSASPRNADANDKSYNPSAEEQQHKEKYETQRLMDQYLALHFGQSTPWLANLTVRPHSQRPDAALNFPVRCAELLHSLCMQFGPAKLGGPAKIKGGAALDLGCAVGGASFALGRLFQKVVGVDYSQAFIDQANDIRASGKVRFSVPVEGAATSKPIDLKLSGDRSMTRFLQADATNLKPSDLAKGRFDGKFDAVLMANLLCRLPDPDAMLKSLPDLLNPGAIVLTVSPFSWMDEYTPRDKWLQQGDQPTSEDALLQKMTDLGFERVYATDMPCVIREHERKYQYIVPHAAAFRFNKAD